MEIPLVDAVVLLSAGGLDHDYRWRRDTLGFERANRSAFLRGAFAVERGPLAAEVGAIVMRRTYADPRHADLVAVLPEARIAWRFGDATTATASYIADLEEPVFAGTRTIRTDEAALSLTHALTETLAATGAVYGEWNRYLGTPRTDRTLGAAIEIAHALGGSTAFEVALGYERLETSLIGDVADVWKVSTGLRYALAR